MHITTLIYSPCSKTSVVPIISRITDITDIACWQGDTICTTLYIVTGFNRFTVSHYGSYSCLPTLKPNLTTSVPRLTNGSTLLDYHVGVPPTMLCAPNWRTTFIYYTKLIMKLHYIFLNILIM